MSKLKARFPNIHFAKASPEDDEAFGVDYELLSKDVRLAAIQIKPESYYKGVAGRFRGTHAHNLSKHKQYTDQTGVPVLFVYSSKEGTLLNPEVMDSINELLNKINITT